MPYSYDLSVGRKVTWESSLECMFCIMSECPERKVERKGLRKTGDGRGRQVRTERDVYALQFQKQSFIEG